MAHHPGIKGEPEVLFVGDRFICNMKLFDITKVPEIGQTKDQKRETRKNIYCSTFIK